MLNINSTTKSYDQESVGLNQLQYNGKQAKLQKSSNGSLMTLVVKLITLGFFLYLIMNLIVALVIGILEFQNDLFFGFICTSTPILCLFIVIKMGLKVDRYLEHNLNRSKRKLHWSGSHWRKELEQGKVETNPMEEIKHLIKIQDERFEKHQLFWKRVKATLVVIWILVAGGVMFTMWLNSFTGGTPLVLQAQVQVEPHEEGYEVVVHSSSFDFLGSGYYSHGLYQYRVRLVEPANGFTHDMGPISLNNYSQGNGKSEWEGLDVTWDGQTGDRHELFGGPFSDPEKAQDRIDAIKAGYQDSDLGNETIRETISVYYIDFDRNGAVTKGDSFVIRSNGTLFAVGPNWTFQIWHRWYYYAGITVQLPDLETLQVPAE